jgi:SAM-dependent methyltransferase
MIPGPTPGSFFALPDNGFGAQGNSADFVIGFYVVTPTFKTAGDGTTSRGPVAVNGFTPFSDPNGLLDSSYITDGPVYNRIGAGAYRVIETGLGAVGRRSDDVDRILDFGCGYGRVLRAIVQHIEPQRVDVFDVDSQGVDFCADEFGVTGLHFTRPWDWASVPFATYDLIWAGSVFTHLGEAFTREMLDLLCSLLRPGGLLVFSSHGDEAIQRAASGFFGERFKLQAARIHADYSARGFCFLPYEDADFAILPFTFERRAEFGMTWMSEAYIAELVRATGNGELQFVRFVPAAWEHMQDGVMLQRRPTP